MGFLALISAILCLCYFHASRNFNYLTACATFFVGFLGFLIQMAILLSNGKKSKNTAIKNTTDLFICFNKKYEENILFINIMHDIINDKSNHINNQVNSIISELIKHGLCSNKLSSENYIQEKTMMLSNWINWLEQIKTGGQYDQQMFDQYFSKKLEIVKDIIKWYNQVVEENNKNDKY